MSEWWSYSLSDFLMFSARTYFRQFELLNQALWPLQLAGLGAGLLLAACMLRPRRHADILRIMASQPIDFVQVSYNALDREVEQRILPLARERRIGVIVNRPFRQGELTGALAGKRLPGWAAEIGCTSWAQVLLKFIVAHPAVTCAIPATSSVAHVRENMLAATGPLPDEALRRRIIADVERLA